VTEVVFLNRAFQKEGKLSKMRQKRGKRRGSKAHDTKSMKKEKKARDKFGAIQWL